MSHLDTPSSGIKFKSLLGVNVHIRRDKGVPGAVALLVEEELNIYAGILGPDRGAGIAKGTVPIGGLGLLKPLYDVRCTEIAQSGFVLGLAHLDHPEQVALEVPAVNDLVLQEYACVAQIYALIMHYQFNLSSIKYAPSE